MEFIQKLLAFAVCLGVLIAVHEFGHFWVARRNGIKVIKFSIGFGKSLLSWKDRHGTEFVIAAIPLGGYVKMVGEPGSEIAPESAHESFANKRVGQRIAVVAAGPGVNLLFAVLLYWGLFMHGISGTVPLIGEVAEGSPAGLAGMVVGEEIVAVDGQPTTTWEEVSLALVNHIGERDARIQITAHASESNVNKDYQLAVRDYMSSKDDPVGLLGLERYFPKVPAILGNVREGKAGARQGLQANDRILTVNGAAVDDWRDWHKVIFDHPGQPLEVTLQRDGREIALTLTPDTITGTDGKAFGQMGVELSKDALTLPPELVRTYNYSPFSALVRAGEHTWSLMGLTVRALWKMLKGDISLDSLSGPITIAKMAGESASYGLETFISFVAYLSISLGVLNLLPIPVLDGGHLMFYLVEWLKGSPVPEKIQQVGNSIGLGLLLMFMGLAIYNDVISF
ncbi:Protease EcfE [gamma proteobacterium HdN1]|nr:Protease EcfE [gamma proteobacterium HdN1]